MSDAHTQPLEIRPLMISRIMEIDWADGHTSQLSFEHLRVECPCAECKGHTPDEAQVITGKEEVSIVDVLPVGNYAIQIHFSDGHSTGIFTWEYLRRLDAQAAGVK
ncbi:gamma-butyrobetaine hydroxylase-like domain-containing protein [Acidithiobacillus sp. M4-SHS-6]|uniref:gamma-butyrobetaine hydroxylase-like domain-containing protein n=1 Tax=Acidithiobacillus sp. M4-SHS-6 TaxID=3383024 RepID=UPI0039BE1A04